MKQTAEEIRDIIKSQMEDAFPHVDIPELFYRKLVNSIYATQSREVGEKLYREVKCSERLPKDDIIVYATHLLITTTFPVVARYNEEKEYWEEYLEEGNGEIKDIISWLEEIPQPVVDQVSEIKICTGCGRLSNEPTIDPSFVACCPDNHYLPIKKYWERSCFPSNDYTKI